MLLLLCGLGLGLCAFLVPAGPSREDFSARTAGELLSLALDPAPGHERASDAAPFWKALLECPAAQKTPAGTTLALGRVQADPTLARAAAESAGELLRLAPASTEGGEAQPLWRALLAGPAARHGSAGPELVLNGCRHSADLDAAPELEDTYAARVSIARELLTLAAEEPELAGLVLRGAETPVKGGANFELHLTGTRQSLELTFDGHPGPALRVEREFQAGTPNDAVARANLVAGLQRAAGSSSGTLTITGEQAPAPGGVDLRLELLGDHQALEARMSGRVLLSVHREAPPVPGAAPLRSVLCAAAALTGALGLWLRARPGTP